MLRTHEKVEAVRQALGTEGVARYHGRTVELCEEGGGYRYAVPAHPQTYDRLEDALDRIDADLPADEWIALRLDRGRGGYRPDEVADLMREAAAFGENKGRRGMTDEMVAELRREMRRTLLAE